MSYKHTRIVPYEAAIHLRSQDETAETNNESQNRFEKSYHHRNHIFISSRHDKEQTHGRKTGKTGSGATRSTSSKSASSAQPFNNSQATRHSLVSATTPKESLKVPPTSTNTHKQQQSSKPRSRSPPLSSDQPIKLLPTTKDTHPVIHPVSIVIENEEDAKMMGGVTAAEHSFPWRRSSIPDGEQATLSITAGDSANNAQTFSNRNDPNLHPGPLTSANFSGAYNKSPEYMGEFATTTKPEEHLSRPHIRDFFNNQLRPSDETQENNAEAAANDGVTRL
ncbi:unnamed protein product [Rotaria magnacalcarata]|uniref:Uncharacterized protein n=1 Tax=Rotaria magnacalcarata TaxID=392030 RepID=A0A819TAB6_9BILA|nr:unnamed protein product [Rotaria magnacalcarata]CAF4074402.1 unnamed protein product [Rotaria magnacalcarata]